MRSVTPSNHVFEKQADDKNQGDPTKWTTWWKVRFKGLQMFFSPSIDHLPSKCLILPASLSNDL